MCQLGREETQTPAGVSGFSTPLTVLYITRYMYVMLFRILFIYWEVGSIKEPHRPIDTSLNRVDCLRYCVYGLVVYLVLGLHSV